MWRGLNGRVVFFHFLLVSVTLVGLSITITNPTCFAQRSCLLVSVVIAILVIVIPSLTLIGVIYQRRAAIVYDLISDSKRAAAGDLRALALPEQRDELYELAIAINHMIAKMVSQVEALNSEHLQYSLVLQNMADGVIITDESGIVVLINPAARRLLKIKKKKAVGRSYAEVVRHHKLIELWQTGNDEGREVVVAAEIGRDLFLQAYVSPFQQAEAPGFLIILQDLTQVHFLQTVRRDLISNISHELRTPLAAIRAVIETLQDGALDEPAVAHQFLDRAGGELDSMTQIVDELLELARIESGRVPLKLVPVEIVDLVSAPVSRLQSHALRQGVQIEVRLAGNLPKVMADADRLGQVVGNILHNAIKFTPRGGTITVRAISKPADKKGPREVIVSVKDTGDGIAKQDLSRVFERFFKSDRARTSGHGGTGLGLAIAKHIVGMHGGRIWVKSKLGKGSTFFFALQAID